MLWYAEFMTSVHLDSDTMPIVLWVALIGCTVLSMQMGFELIDSGGKQLLYMGCCGVLAAYTGSLIAQWWLHYNILVPALGIWVGCLTIVEVLRK